MNSESIHEQTNEPSRSFRDDLSDSLTAEQKTFARVLGQALAEAWRRRWQQPQEDLPAAP